MSRVENGRQGSIEARQGRRLSTRRVCEIGPGLLGSLLLHGLFGLLILFLIARSTPGPLQIHFLPVDLVQTAEPTRSAPQHAGTFVPRERRPARIVPSSRRPPVALSPTRKSPPPDTLEIRLRELAKLRQPDSTLPHLDNGTADAAAANGDPAAGAGYRVRDFLRAQIERRWSLDLGRARNVVVLIHVVVARDGRVTHADIVDRAHYANDAAWRAIALSARNAVLLSSPLNLPAGYRAAPIDTTIALSSRDVVR